jgi:hypothetical protein
MLEEEITNQLPIIPQEVGDLKKMTEYLKEIKRFFSSREYNLSCPYEITVQQDL